MEILLEKRKISVTVCPSTEKKTSPVPLLERRKKGET
jgi:hypothetical protein